MKVGIATADITPEKPVIFDGWEREAPSAGIDSRIEGTCIVFDNGNTRLGLMALDLLAVDDFLMVPIRREAEAHSIPHRNMMVNTSHTHSGPNMSPCRSLVCGYDEEYLQWCRDEIRGLIPAAAENLQEASMDYTVGTCSMAVYRRGVPPGESTPRMMPNPDEPIDMDVPVLRVLASDGTPRAVIFSYACHPSTIMSPNIGADYPGFAREHVADAIPGCTPVFLQGCGGDTKPRNITPEFTFGHESLQAVRELGHELGRAVLTALCGEPTRLSEDLAADAELVMIPFTRQPTDDDLCEADEKGHLEARWAEAVRRVHDSGHMLPLQWPLEIQVFNLGGLIVAGMAAETCRDVGMNIKNRLADLDVCTLGYTNGGWDYFASKATMTHPAYRHSYEAERSFTDTIWPCAQPRGWAPEAEDILIDAIKGIVREIA